MTISPSQGLKKAKISMALFFIMISEALLADPCQPACFRLSFNDYVDHYYDYVVSRQHFLALVELSNGQGEKSSIRESEARAIAASAVSLSGDDINAIRHFEKRSSEGNIWVYRISFDGLSFDEDILVAPDGSVIRSKRFDGRMPAQPICSDSGLL